MIGNDIVDLQLAYRQTNWQRKGWLEKIFTYNEQSRILETADPDLMIWQFWSRKETAYKAHQRRFSLLPKLNPKDFECLINGNVQIEDYQYKVETKSNKKYIYSYTAINEAKLFSKVFGKQTNLKLELQKILSQKIKTSHEISIAKELNGVPIVFINNIKQNINVSFTHHGAYSAYIVDLQKI